MSSVSLSPCFPNWISLLLNIFRCCCSEFHGFWWAALKRNHNLNDLHVNSSRCWLDRQIPSFSQPQTQSRMRFASRDINFQLPYELIQAARAHTKSIEMLIGTLLSILVDWRSEVYWTFEIGRKGDYWKLCASKFIIHFTHNLYH